ncbi:ATP-dependent DNA helicase Q1 [Aedes albopictus]|uniref:ATP-dependent DNA helicase n=1 Tax=Aedes albopictus TaxID=7160 RepID=A0ABM1Y183_AEDAL|nr:ATP-dependent DNA helicase Q1-like [Aedes albopictus]
MESHDEEGDTRDVGCSSSEQIDVDTRLKAINRELDEISTELSRLNARRKKLLDLKEKLRIQKQQEQSSIIAKKDWESEEFSWSKETRRVLKEVFHMRDFRAQQLATINALLAKQNVLLLAPTGGGKSLCYQLPAVVSKGITLVVSPLISLMEDQVWALKKLGIKAEYLCGTSEKELVSSVHKCLREGDDDSLKLLFVTPERINRSARFKTALQKCYNVKKLAQIAIDEVHCCSQWGHDFRTDYKELGIFKTLFPDVPILGVTATATTKVISDVQKMLQLSECLTLNAPFNRPNLYYHVLEKPTDKEELYDLLADLLKRKYHRMSGIIYTFTVKETAEISTELLQREVKVLPYHGQNMDPKQRSKTHQKWIDNEIQAVVATTAFGMGIDKPDVRFVIHHTLSKTMENFYQESGRAGRDGKRADCILLYRFTDMFRISTMSFSEYGGLDNLYSMVKYCINGKDCRRLLISRHFADVWDDTHCDKLCDRCFFRDKVQLPEQDITTHYHTLLAIIRRAETLQTKLTALKLVDAWYHKGSPKNRLETPPPLLDRFIGEQIVAFLIVNGYLKEDFQITPYSTFSYIVRGPAIPNTDSLRFQGARVLRVPKDSLKSIMRNESTAVSTTTSTSEDVQLVSVTSSTSFNGSRTVFRTSTPKRKVVESSDRDETCSIRSDASEASHLSSTHLNGHKRKGESKRRKTGSVGSTFSQTKEDTNVSKSLNETTLTKTESSSTKDDDDEDVLFVPNDDEVIEIL